MLSDQDISEVFKNFVSLTALYEFSSQIDGILKGLFRIQEGNINILLGKYAGEKNSHILEDLFKKKGIGKSDYPSIERLLSDIKQQITKARVLKLSLAIDPTQETIDKIGFWVKKNIGQDVVMDFQRDESIIGGAVISFNGVYKDFSLRKSFEDIFLNRKNEIFNIK